MERAVRIKIWDIVVDLVGDAVEEISFITDTIRSKIVPATALPKVLLSVDEANEVSTTVFRHRRVTIKEKIRFATNSMETEDV